MEYRHFAPFMTFMALFALVTLIGFVSCERRARCSPLDCETLHSADQRNYCRALSKNDKSYCEFIKEHDLRAKCRAMVRE